MRHLVHGSTRGAPCTVRDEARRSDVREQAAEPREYTVRRSREHGAFDELVAFNRKLEEADARSGLPGHLQAHIRGVQGAGDCGTDPYTYMSASCRTVGGAYRT